MMGLMASEKRETAASLHNHQHHYHFDISYFKQTIHILWDAAYNGHGYAPKAK
jgi:hypothetical protein